MSCGLPESTRCFLRRFGLIDKEANLLQAGLLTATNIEDASEHDLLAAGLNRDQIRHLRYVFVFRDAFGLPDRGKPEMAPGALRTAAPSEARHLHAAEPPRPPESSPRGNDVTLAREAELASFLGRLGKKKKELLK